MAIAAARPEPIPVYAEMSSINPVLLFPEALKARGAAIGTAFAGSLTLGAGQFCTNPGLLVAIGDKGLDAFVNAATQAIEEAAAAVMLTTGIHAAYDQGVAVLKAHEGVDRLACGRPAEGPNAAQVAFFATDAGTFLADRRLHQEVFGPSSLLVRCTDVDEAAQVMDAIEGQLTIALHIDRGDTAVARALIPLLETKAGRLLVNGFGTGVEVSHAMVHGGPYPATSDGRTTSVGTLAIDRFLRPICYQDMPAALLPEALGDGNPLGIWRTIDGALTRD
jgi:NADP-dependent aldehyde dehydrogenase